MTTALSQKQRAELSRHSRVGTATAFQQLARFLKHDRWLGVANIYRSSAAEKLRRDLKAKRQPNMRNLAQYVAASAPLHAADGWGFVARALEATIRGDPDAARHLAYYGELRAALSLLAAQGIGIFNGPHAVVEASGEARVFTGNGTHVMTWLALRHWMRSTESATVVGALVGQSGESIDTWVSNLPAGGPWSALGARWLSSWGIDLRDAIHDRGARNKASYLPSQLYNVRALNPVATTEFVSEWWRTFEPTVGAPFELLDRHLLRATLERSFFATRGVTPAQGQQLFRRDVSAAKLATTGNGSLDDSLGRFLVRDGHQVSSQLLSEASRHDAPEVPRQHLQVISRATLLLRLASGAASELLERAGITAEQLAFWRRSVGEDRALWRPGEEPGFLTDLWGDIEAALENLAALVPPEPTSYRALQDLCAPDLAIVAGAERVALWGIAA